ncbi:reverse transcriptase family protein [Variovorax sp. EBFNA2]|uniref:reverse transcriptase family protein n=1 Tax=Variovorax sp. EBFNA2 TaxID=3342097 RepID=UPI0029BFB4CF|nr:reverse transcriptase family protein [Variovorax boronicumulans]WPG36220.1 reverse transcriptase family protein [Variovorax boronicumulans]
MSLILSKPSYPFDPIWTSEKLAKALRTELAELEAVAAVADRSYRPVQIEPGSTREVFSAKPRLKAIQRRIKEVILQRVGFPEYLTGSVKGRDYITNAKLHAGARILICEDVSKFFPSVTAERVHDIWRHFFGFGDEVARLLTKLTTKAGTLPQGASTSSYLANLVLWRDEPHLQAKLAEHGLTYSRYVDDMAMSSNLYITPAEQERIIADVYGVLRRNGLSAKRKKHEISSSSQRMIVTKVIVNVKPSWSKARRSAVRTQVYELEKRVASGGDGTDLRKFADRTSNLVGQLGRFHAREAGLLRARVRNARETIYAAAQAFDATSKVPCALQSSGHESPPPWETLLAQ